MDEVQDLIECLKFRIKTKINSLSADEVLNSVVYLYRDIISKKEKTKDDLMLLGQVDRLQHLMDDAHVL